MSVTASVSVSVSVLVIVSPGHPTESRVSREKGDRHARLSPECNCGVVAIYLGGAGSKPNMLNAGNSGTTCFARRRKPSFAFCSVVNISSNPCR